MKRLFRSKLTKAILVPIGLFAFLIPFSLLLGWGLFAALFFWFIATPALAFAIPSWMSKQGIQVRESFIGLVIFYALMVFIIFEHYKTDTFLIVMASLVTNMVIFLIVKIADLKVAR